jgi:formate dehydrogenase major subunit
MSTTRRTFLVASSGSLAGLLGLDGAPAAASDPAKTSSLALHRTVCPFCAVGCGALVAVEQGKVCHVEGDPQHPVNAGSLCAKGAAMLQIGDNPRRVTKIKYRAPGATAWEEKDWDWAIRRIAERIHETRDATLQAADPAGQAVPRTRAVASLGGASLSNEECYLLAKLARALGLVYLEHEARAGHHATLAALGATFGRRTMTPPLADLARADVILAIGCNVAENFPIAMKWITKAQQRGAKLLAVDPRFTRTAAVADQHIPLRVGTDIALIGGLIHYALDGGRIDKAFLVAETNASFLVDPAYAFDAGRFGPIDHGAYTKQHWQFQRDAQGNIRQDPSLEDPHCVFQLVKRHFARYTLDTVAKICGMPLEQLRQLAETVVSTSGPDRSGAIVYSAGATQHSHGTQNVRSFAILQLLLGNIGPAGRGLYALDGQSNSHGACDHGLWFDPQHDGDGSPRTLFEAIEQGEVQGLLVWEQNPAVNNPDLQRSWRSLDKLRWLVVADCWETETATFWKRPGAVAEQIDTEVFLLPAATWLEKAGSLTSSGSLTQWRPKVIDPPGDCQSELWILDRLCRELKRRYAAGGTSLEPIVQRVWDYGDPPDPQRVAEEIKVSPRLDPSAGPACLFAPSLADGPLPEHYEPLEGPVENLLSPQQHNPLARCSWPDRLGKAAEYPIVATTFAVAEHWESGSTTRNLPWLVELVPNAFAEIGRQLARSKGIAHGDLITIRTARGEITLHALVTGRLKPLEVNGKPVEQIAVLWQFGYAGLATGPSAHVLTPSVFDPVSGTPEYKAFLCDVRKARK